MKRAEIIATIEYFSSVHCCSFQSEDIDEEEIIPRMSQSELENKTTSTVSDFVESDAIAIDFLSTSTFTFEIYHSSIYGFR